MFVRAHFSLLEGARTAFFLVCRCCSGSTVSGRRTLVCASFFCLFLFVAVVGCAALMTFHTRETQHLFAQDDGSRNSSVGGIVVLTDGCQLFASVCVLCLMAILLAAVLSLLRSRRAWSVEGECGAEHCPHKAPPLRTGNMGVSHLAVIMDGNRRYGRKHCGTAAATPSPSPERQNELSRLCGAVVYGDDRDDAGSFPTDAGEGANAGDTATRLQLFCSLIRGTPLDGHRCGGKKLLEFIHYAMDAGIPMLSVYAFSTDNWRRPEREVNVLMALFFFFFQRVRAAARQDGMFIRFVCTKPELIPPRILSLMKAIECETRLLPQRRITVNICVSYSGQTEVALASTRVMRRRWLCGDVARPVTTDELQHEMLRSLTQDEYEAADADVFSHSIPCEPQLIMRTSGEQRLSNFLSFESAYSELFFLSKSWPEVTSDDLSAALASYGSRDIRLGR